jgi:hypothetical protein
MLALVRKAAPGLRSHVKQKQDVVKARRFTTEAVQKEEAEHDDDYEEDTRHRRNPNESRYSYSEDADVPAWVSVVEGRPFDRSGAEYEQWVRQIRRQSYRGRSTRWSRASLPNKYKTGKSLVEKVCLRIF